MIAPPLSRQSEMDEARRRVWFQHSCSSAPDRCCTCCCAIPRRSSPRWHRLRPAIATIRWRRWRDAAIGTTMIVTDHRLAATTHFQRGIANDQEVPVSGCWLWHALSPGDQGDAEGDAADPEQAADPVRRRRSGRFRHFRHRVRDRARQTRDRGSLRRQLRTRTRDQRHGEGGVSFRHPGPDRQVHLFLHAAGCGEGLGACDSHRRNPDRRQTLRRDSRGRPVRGGWPERVVPDDPGVQRASLQRRGHRRGGRGQRPAATESWPDPRSSPG